MQVKNNPFRDRTENFIHGFQSAERHGERLKRKSPSFREAFCAIRDNFADFFPRPQNGKRMENSGDCFVNGRTKRVEKSFNKHNENNGRI